MKIVLQSYLKIVIMTLIVSVAAMALVSCATIGNYSPLQQQALAWTALEGIYTKTDNYLKFELIDVETAKEIRTRGQEIEEALNLAAFSGSEDEILMALDMAIRLNDYLLLKGGTK